MYNPIRPASIARVAVAFAFGASVNASADVAINEIVVSTTSTDREFLELLASPGESLNDLSVLEVRSGGQIDTVISLSGATAGDNGYFLLASPEAESVLGVTADLGISNNTFTNTSQTYLLVSGFSGLSGVDIDANDDGVIDNAPWTAILDSVAVIDDDSPIIYGTNVLGPDGTFLAPGGFRSPEGTGTFLLHDFGDIGAYTPIAGTFEPIDAPLVKIHEIQGSGTSSPLDGQVISVEAIVVGDFQESDSDDTRNLRGFFLQEEDEDTDADPSTSEGIFVFDGGSPNVDVNVGDQVKVSGTVDEFFGETQIDSITAIEVLSSGTSLPAPAVISLPAQNATLSQDGDYQPDLEAYEGMRVIVEGELLINEMFQLDRFNEIKLVQGSRPQQFTQTNAPDAVGFDDHKMAIGMRQITYDDGLNEQNAPIGLLDGFGPAFDSLNAPRMGDTITGLSGVLDYKWAGNGASGATWRIRSVVDGSVEVNGQNARPETPEDVDGSLKIASFNVLNFFTTLDDGGNLTAIGLGPRGADDLTRFGGEPPAGTDPDAEFLRQREKLVQAILAIDADVLGLIELENDFLPGSAGNAIENLVAAINDAVGEEIYDWIRPENDFIGTDAIANGIIYKTDNLNVLGSAVLTFAEPSAETTFELADKLNAVVPSGDQVGDFSRNRPALAATFEDDDGEVFTVAVNHFKSKGDSNLEDLAEAAQAALNSGVTTISQADIDALIADPNYDQIDGQAFWNQVRTDAAIELADWLASDPTNSFDDDHIILGDLNAYAQEDPVTTLVDLGYVDLAAKFLGEQAYSFVFDGQTGTLDYALANDSLAPQIAGITEWHINADEADAIDYNLDFGRDPNYFDANTPARNSDHDTVIVGMQLGFDVAATPRCNGRLATIYVDEDRYIVGGKQDGRRYYGVLQGTQGDDVIVGTKKRDVILGRAGNDTICGREGADQLIAGKGDDLIFGEAGKDRLIGGKGNDQMFGGTGRDLLVGGAGKDAADGGPQRDLCVGAELARVDCERP